MVPFVFRVGNQVMTAIVALDTFGRMLETGAAMWSLKRQGWLWRDIAHRMVPAWMWNAARYCKAFGAVSGRCPARTKSRGPL